MALYEYRCRTCDSVFELRRPMSESNEPAVCPAGHEGAVRMLSVFASVGTPQPATPGGPCGGSCACYPG
jgi:putative FmdB family regulatory protein